jgi:hypothetical protein
MTTTLGTALLPHWCPTGHTPSQRKMIQRMRAQKLREEVVEKERDEHFNAIRPMIPAKQEWTVKKKTNMPTLTTSDDDMDLLDDDKSPSIKEGSPPAGFRDVEGEITQLCLGPK